MHEYPWARRGDNIALLVEQARVHRVICNAFGHVTCVANLRKHLVVETDDHRDGVDLDDMGTSGWST